MLGEEWRWLYKPFRCKPYLICKGAAGRLQLTFGHCIIVLSDRKDQLWRESALLLLWPPGWGRMGDPAEHVTFWNETQISVSPAFLNRWYTNNIRILCWGAWNLIYVIETLWPFYFRGTVKVTVRIFHKENPLIRGEAAYHNMMRIPRAADKGNVHPCWENQPGEQTLAHCLNPWYDAPRFSDYTTSWMMLLNAYWAFEKICDPDPRGNAAAQAPTGTLLYAERFSDTSISLWYQLPSGHRVSTDALLLQSNSHPAGKLLLSLKGILNTVFVFINVNIWLLLSDGVVSSLQYSVIAVNEEKIIVSLHIITLIWWTWQ